MSRKRDIRRARRERDQEKRNPEQLKMLFILLFK